MLPVWSCMCQVKGVTYLPNSVWRPDWHVVCLIFLSGYFFFGGLGTDIVCLMRLRGDRDLIESVWLSVSIAFPFCVKN